MNRRTNKWWFSLAFLCCLGCGSEGTESVGTVVEEEPNSPGNTDLTFFDREGEQQTPSTLPDTYEDSVDPEEPLDASWDPEVQTGDDDTAGGNLDALSGPDDGEETEVPVLNPSHRMVVNNCCCFGMCPNWSAAFAANNPVKHEAADGGEIDEQRDNDNTYSFGGQSPRNPSSPALQHHHSSFVTPNVHVAK